MTELDEMKDQLNALISQLAFIDHENDTDLTTHVQFVISELNDLRAQNQITESEYFELAQDKLQVSELDSILREDEVLRHAQDILRQLPGLISKMLFA